MSRNYDTRRIVALSFSQSAQASQYFYCQSDPTNQFPERHMMKWIEEEKPRSQTVKSTAQLSWIKSRVHASREYVSTCGLRFESHLELIDTYGSTYDACGEVSML